jgi:hypothetical protein
MKPVGIEQLRCGSEISGRDDFVAGRENRDANAPAHLDSRSGHDEN